MKRTIITLAFLSVTALLPAQLAPVITSWIINTTGETGYGNILSNVQQVQYSNDYVYVSSTCIPGYDIGPWAGNPNIPANQNFVFKITRNPQPNTGTLTQTPLGHIGVWTNGVSLFNAKDAASYNNQNVWHQDAVVVEGASFDDCLGHPAPNGEYHLHLNPPCLYEDGDNSQHSPVIGYAFDGYPIYGTFGFADTNGGGGIVQMKSSYRLRNITVRNTYADGSSVTAGPNVSGQYPLGYYIEDYEYVPGFGTLDEHNGRFCVTPEYPSGIYAYFVTIDSIAQPVYPYIIGPTYYGIVTPGNTGPGSGHNTPTETVVTYTPTTGIEEADFNFGYYPNPANEFLNFTSTSLIDRILIYNMEGRTLLSETINGHSGSLSLSGLLPGIYSMEVVSASVHNYVKIVVE